VSKEVGMSEASWQCQNHKCGLIFQWNRLIGIASYFLQEKPENRHVPGNTRPDGCPECGHDEVDCLEG